MNPRKEVVVHQRPVRCGEEMSFAFGLRYDASVHIIEVESDHIQLRQLRMRDRSFLGGRIDVGEVTLKVPAAAVLTDIDEERTAYQITCGQRYAGSLASAFALGERPEVDDVLATVDSKEASATAGGIGE